MSEEWCKHANRPTGQPRFASARELLCVRACARAQQHTQGFQCPRVAGRNQYDLSTLLHACSRRTHTAHLRRSSRRKSKGIRNLTCMPGVHAACARAQFDVHAVCTFAIITKRFALASWWLCHFEWITANGRKAQLLCAAIHDCWL